MLQLTLNAIFGYVFARFGLNALGRGWAFARDGWRALAAHAPGAAQDITQRALVEQGTRFLIGGALWLAGGAAALAAAVVFGLRAYGVMVGGGPLW